MDEPKQTFWGKALSKGAALLRPLIGKPERDITPPSGQPDELEIPCCGPAVHIAYRGKSDDRMYMAYNRRWQEVRYYQTNGLRVFCGTCRRRIY